MEQLPNYDYEDGHEDFALDVKYFAKKLMGNPSIKLAKQLQTLVDVFVTYQLTKSKTLED